jgi:hypothetical protein
MREQLVMGGGQGDEGRALAGDAALYCQFGGRDDTQSWVVEHDEIMFKGFFSGHVLEPITRGDSKLAEL